MSVYVCVFLQVIENTGAHVAFALKILNGMPFLFAQNLYIYIYKSHEVYIYIRGRINKINICICVANTCILCISTCIYIYTYI